MKSLEGVCREAEKEIMSTLQTLIRGDTVDYSAIIHRHLSAWVEEVAKEIEGFRPAISFGGAGFCVGTTAAARLLRERAKGKT